MRILICGVGAIGSNLAANLLPDLGPEHEITILDMDEVEERNVRAGTQFYTRDQIGQAKVDALEYNLYKAFEKEVKTINRQFQQQFHGTTLPYDLVLDCFDNNATRGEVVSHASPSTAVLHIGFSDQFTFAIEWNDNYQVPSDITSGMDICEMEGASSFVKMVSALASLITQNFIRENVKDSFIGNKMSITKIQ